MTQDYLVGELSVRLEQLQGVAADDAAQEVARLRHDIEAGAAALLGQAVANALAVADALCWESLASGDGATFCRQSEIAADLHLFAVCACLLTDG
jgi:hypothetical protein